MPVILPLVKGFVSELYLIYTSASAVDEGLGLQVWGGVCIYCVSRRSSGYVDHTAAPGPKQSQDYRRGRGQTSNMPPLGYLLCGLDKPRYKRLLRYLVKNTIKRFI